MTNEEKSSALEDNLPMVNYIMLHRIYDLLTIIANKLVGADDVSKMISYHEEGYLLGPAPSYSAPNEEDDSQQTLF
jgi:hypothetical protein